MKRCGKIVSVMALMPSVRESKRAELRLHIGGKIGVRLGGDLQRLGHAVARAG